MTQAKKHTLAWLGVGLLFSLLVLLVVLTGLSGKVMITDPDGISEAADMVMHCIQAGDWDTLENVVLGSPALTPWGGEADSPEKQIWDAYQESLHWTCQKGFGIQDAYVTQNVTVACLDIAAVTKSMVDLLTDTDTADSGQLADALHSAIQLVLETDAPVMEREMTLTFLREKGQWLVLPNKAFLELLSGFTAH